jgi:hypothetical protein
MTFTEAALEVLRSAGEPLHYKRITELAIERNLLSHVGKTPEVTMSSRLAMMVKKDRGQAPIIKVKPGVFAIRESAKQELSPEMLAAIEEVEGETDGVVDVNAEVVAEAVVVEAKPPALPGADVFPEEEGDDDPILAGLEQETEGGDRNGRRRRRRRRRGKGDKPDAAPEAAPRPEPAREASRERERDRDRDRDRDRGRDAPRDSGRDGRASREPRESMRSPQVEREDSLDFNRQPGEGDLLGKDLADAVWHVLSRGERVPHSFSRVADLLVRRGRLSGSPTALAPTIGAAVRADVARAERSQQRPRFRLRGSRVVLSEWLLARQLVRSEQDFVNAADRYGNELRRALIQRLTELPTAGFAELVATWLNAEGITALRAVRRPGSTGSELHFAGTRKTGSEELRLAIVVLRGGRDIDREGVIDVRGALHHYGQASAAWVVTTGRTTSGARDEANAVGAAACALFDGTALAAAMERLGIAVRRYVMAHYEIDYDLLEMLGDTPEQRERREREAERERQSARNESRNERFSTPPSERGRGSQEGGRGQPLSPDSEAPPLHMRAPVPSSPDWDDVDAPEPEQHVRVVGDLDAAEEGDFDGDDDHERDAEADEVYDLEDSADADADAGEDLDDAADDIDPDSDEDLDEEPDEVRADADADADVDDSDADSDADESDEEGGEDDAPESEEEAPEADEPRRNTR